MNVVVAAALALTAAGADAQSLKQQYPSCDLKAQHALKGTIGGSVTDPRQAHVAMRADVLQADLGTARKARRVSEATAQRLFQRVAAVRTGANRYTKKQGFLSAAEVASYDRTLDGIATQICHR